MWLFMYLNVWVCGHQPRPLRPGHHHQYVARQTGRIFLGPTLPECPCAPALCFRSTSVSDSDLGYHAVCKKGAHTHTQSCNIYAQKVTRHEQSQNAIPDICGFLFVINPLQVHWQTIFHSRSEKGWCLNSAWHQLSVLVGNVNVHFFQNERTPRAEFAAGRDFA